MRATMRAIIALAGVTAWPLAAQASVYGFTFAGPGVSGALNITYEVNPNSGVLPGTSPNPVDPIGSYVITDVSGSFSDDNIGISNAAITGVAPLNRVNPEPTNLRAPNSFSLLPVQNGVQGDGPLSPGLHYDNLFYPAGSPATSSDYPFSGGVLDIYGVIFRIDNGDYVNLWSNGIVPKAGLNYGVAVTDTIDALDYTSGVTITAVPEPASWAMLIAGIGVAGNGLRRRVRVAYA